MRPISLIAALFLTVAATPMATAPAARPSGPPPSASAAFEQRETWCEQYANWFVSQMPLAGTLPPDVRPTQRFEVEFNSCKPNPRLYERQTRAELHR